MKKKKKREGERNRVFIYTHVYWEEEEEKKKCSKKKKSQNIINWQWHGNEAYIKSFWISCSTVTFLGQIYYLTKLVQHNYSLQIPEDMQKNFVKFSFCSLSKIRTSQSFIFSVYMKKIMTMIWQSSNYRQNAHIINTHKKITLRTIELMNLHMLRRRGEKEGRCE